MTKLKKRVMLAALVVLVAASLLLYVPQGSAGRSTRALQRPVQFDFSLTVTPDTVTLRPGESASCTVSVRLIRGPAQEVYFVWSYPPELPATLSPGRGTPPFTSTFRITTEPSTTPGTYEFGITVTPIGGGVEKTAVVTLTVTEAAGFDFSVKVSPSIVTMTPGEPASPTVNVGLVSGSAQEVSLTYMIPAVAGPDPGIGASISPTKGTPPFTSTLRITTATDTPPGTYTINVVGVSGSLSRTATFTLAIVGPGAFDFSVTASPDSVSLRPGESASSTLSTKLVTGPAQEVSFMYTVPQVVGVGASISPGKGTPPFTSTVRISTTLQTPPGTYMINMAAVGGGVEKRISITLRVVVGGQPQPTATDWAVGEVWMLPSNPRPGDQVSFSAKISALSSDSAFPQTVRVHIYLDNRRIAAGTASVPREGLAVTVSAGTRWTAIAGSHTVRFTVDPADGIEYDDPDTGNNSGELSFTVSQTTRPPSGFDFSITVTPEQQSLTPEGSVAYDIYVDLEGGTSETVSLTVSGLPEDATYAFDPPTGLPYFPSTLTVYVPQYTAAGAAMPAGTYTLTVSVEGAGLVRTATTMLVVQAAEVTTTQMAETSTQAPLTSAATTQVATQTKGGSGEGLGGGVIFLGLLIVAIVAAGVYYISKRRKSKA